MNGADPDSPRDRARSWDLLEEPDASWAPADVADDDQQGGLSSADRRVLTLLSGLLVFATLCGLVLPNTLGTIGPDYRAICERLPIEPAQQLLSPDAQPSGYWVSPGSLSCTFTGPPTSNPQILVQMVVETQRPTASAPRYPGLTADALPAIEVDGATRAGLEVTTSAALLIVEMDDSTYSLFVSGGAIGSDGEQVVQAFEALLPALAEQQPPSASQVERSGDNPCRVVSADQLPEFGETVTQWPSWSESEGSCVLSSSLDDPGAMDLEITSRIDTSAQEYDRVKATYSSWEQRTAQAHPDQLLMARDGSRAAAHRDGITVTVELGPDRSVDSEVLTRWVTSTLAKRS